MEGGVRKRDRFAAIYAVNVGEFLKGGGEKFILHEDISIAHKVGEYINN